VFHGEKERDNWKGETLRGKGRWSEIKEKEEEVEKGGVEKSEGGGGEKNNRGCMGEGR
jgi:hypothetical protein